MKRTAAIGLLFAAATVLALTVAAAGATDDERRLAERYAPVVMLVEQTEECGQGEPYEPMDVDDLFDDIKSHRAGLPTQPRRRPASSSFES